MKLCILFSGQGAQTPGMGKEIYESSQYACEIIDRAGEDVKHLLFNATAEELTQTKNVQPALYTLSCAKYMDFLHTDGRDIAAVAGFSLGEYAAMFAAGVFTFEEGLDLIRKRANLMQQNAEENPQGMVAILGADAAAVHEIIEECKGNEVLEAANYNAPGQIVVGGESIAIERVLELSKKQNFKSVRLAVNMAGHTSLQNNVSQFLLEALNKMELHPPQIPVISNITARPHSLEEIPQSLSAQTSKPVRWEESMLFLRDIGIEEYIELGIGSTLIGLNKRIFANKEGAYVSKAI